jgi:Xaa-Pro aminopeptidase
MQHSTGKLPDLLSSMKKNGIDAYIIPSTDPHLEENIPDHWRIVQWMTGFTGSAATVVITDSFAGLWTDSRYFLQAEEQLKGTGFKLVKGSVSNLPDFFEWLVSNLSEESVVGFDGRLFSVDWIRKLEKLVKNKKFRLQSDCDLISALLLHRPALNSTPAFELSVAYCGKEREKKIAEVREEMKRIKVAYQLLVSPDDIMWMLNIRGNDLEYSPLLLSFAIISEYQIMLFCNQVMIPEIIAVEFRELNIVILPYDQIYNALSALPEDSSILLNSKMTSVSLFDSIPEGMIIIEEISIPSRLKVIKNNVEIENIANVMIKDGTALSKFFFWLENNLEESEITEFVCSDKILEMRLMQDGFLGPSFQSIVGFNEHGALPHYTATHSSGARINRNGILLIDSGGQYLEGTTDITRTISTGTATQKQKKDFTLILKGLISIASAKFPVGTRGYQIDILARKSLWDNGLNYGHGTGHGVGFCLNVHEGPVSISPAAQSETANRLEPGMVISDEPAIYREGEYGIRTENLIVCYRDEETEFGQFLKFETVSLCYIDKSLIDISLLDEKEIEWLNSYHQIVYNKLSPHLTSDEKEWLKTKTTPI